MNSDPIKLIYIISSAHSGSTLLDLTLSRHESIIGLGEVVNILKGRQKSNEGTEAMCSCGKTMDNCPFWSKYYLIHNKAPEPGEFSDNYKHLLEACTHYGKPVIVDSSKKRNKLSEFRKLEEQGLIELRVIHLLKDVRAWVASTRDLSIKQGRKKSYLRLFRSWYRKNYGIQKTLQQGNYNSISISYEELCFDTESAISKLITFSGLSPEKFSLENPADTHIAFGNRMKRASQERLRIVYDHRWFKRYSINLFAILLPHIFLWNSKNTYKS